MPFKGEWPKIVFDGLDKAQGRTGTPEPPAPAVGSTRPRSPGAEAAAAALRAFGPKALKKEIKERGLQERSEGMVEKAELVALLLEDGWRPPQEGSDDETDDEERTRLC